MLPTHEPTKKKIASLPHLLSVTLEFQSWTALNHLFGPRQLVPSSDRPSTQARNVFFMCLVFCCSWVGGRRATRLSVRTSIPGGRAHFHPLPLSARSG